MMFKNTLSKILLHYKIKPYRLSQDEYGISLDFDIKKLFSKVSQRSNAPIIFDVGANIGQSTKKFKKYLPNAVIHTFEPSHKTFQILISNTLQFDNVKNNNIGLGSLENNLTFFQNKNDDISSFLQPTGLLWGEVEDELVLKISTLDSYCSLNAINEINYLKVDTQGYEFEVLQGSKSMLSKSAIDIIQLEITIEKLYEEMPRIDDILKYLMDMDYHLVAFYGYHNQKIKARWTDAIFISPLFLDKYA